ncbi:MAG: hypothetical protein ACOC3V_05390 [bacterium]
MNNKGKRTSIDFSKHSHRVEIYKCGEKEIRIDHLQIDTSRTNYIQFINTDEICSVTGDFGNWIFCRPFIPSSNEGVTDSYWIEKLNTRSEQNLDKLDMAAISKRIEELLDGDLDKMGFDEDEIDDVKSWYEDLLEETHDEYSYIAKAWRDYSRPSTIEDEDVPHITVVPIWLKIVFDGFEEICKRIKENEKIF